MYFTFEVRFGSTLSPSPSSSTSFKDYVEALSILVRGSIKEKLHWIFRFYDVDEDGKLTREVRGEECAC